MIWRDHVLQFWLKIGNEGDKISRKKLKILEKNFQSRRQILTARGVYKYKIRCRRYFLKYFFFIFKEGECQQK